MKRQNCTLFVRFRIIAAVLSVLISMGIVNPVTVHALPQSTPTTYTLTYARGDGVGNPPAAVTGVKGSTVTIAENELTKGSVIGTVDFHISENHDQAAEQAVSVTSETTFEPDGWKATENGTEVSYQPNDVYTFAEFNEELVPAWQESTTVEKYSYIPERNGYTFSGWYEAPADGNRIDTAAPGTIDSPEAGLTYYAHWTAVPDDLMMSPASAGTPEENTAYCVLKLYSDPETLYKTVYVPKGTYADRPTDLTRENYTLSNWYYYPEEEEAVHKPTYTYVVEFEKMPMTVDSFQLIAKWQPNKMTVTFHPDNGKDNFTKLVDYDSFAEQPTYVSFIGHTLRCWSLEPNTLVGYDFKNTRVHENIDLYAVWNVNHYTIKFEDNGGEGDIPPVTLLYTDSYTIPGNTFTPPEGYELAKDVTWKDKNGVSYKAGQTVRGLYPEDQGSVTMIAQWQPLDYTVTYVKGQATDGVLPQPTTAPYDSTITLAGNSMSYYSQLAGYYKVDLFQNKSNADTDTLPSIPVTVTDTGTQNGWFTGALHYDAGSSYTINGDVTLQPDLVYSRDRTKVTLPAVPARSGYTQTGWYWSSVTCDETWVGKVGETLDLRGDEFDGYGHFRLYAGWNDPYHCEVSFLTNGAAPIDKQKVLYNDKVQEPTEKEHWYGHNFGGWYTDPDFVHPYDFSTRITTEDDFTLYEKWTINISYGASDSTVQFPQGIPASTAIVIDDGKTVKLAENHAVKASSTRPLNIDFSANGHGQDPKGLYKELPYLYTADGWNLSMYMTGTHYASGAAVTSTWEADEPILMCDRTIYTQFKESYGTTEITLPVIEGAAGYSSSGWYTAAQGGDKVGNLGETITVGHEYDGKTLYAHWKEPVNVTVRFKDTDAREPQDLSGYTRTFQTMETVSKDIDLSDQITALQDLYYVIDSEVPTSVDGTRADIVLSVHHDALENQEISDDKEVHRTIRYTLPGASAADIVQTGVYEIETSLIMDLVTKKQTLTDRYLTVTGLPAYTLPVVPGYAASQPEVAEVSAYTADTIRDSTVLITYARTGLWCITYLDCKGNPVSVQWVETGRDPVKPAGYGYPDIYNVSAHQDVRPVRCSAYEKYVVPDTADRG